MQIIQASEAHRPGRTMSAVKFLEMCADKEALQMILKTPKSLRLAMSLLFISSFTLWHTQTPISDALMEWALNALT